MPCSPTPWELQSQGPHSPTKHNTDHMPIAGLYNMYYKLYNMYSIHIRVLLYTCVKKNCHAWTKLTSLLFHSPVNYVHHAILHFS